VSPNALPAAPTTWVLLPSPDKAAPLARAIMGKEYTGKLVLRGKVPWLAVADAPAFKHRLDLPNHGGLTALERMTLRGLLAVAEETTDPGESK
jgi:hypothetical protein